MEVLTRTVERMGASHPIYTFRYLTGRTHSILAGLERVKPVPNRGNLCDQGPYNGQLLGKQTARLGEGITPRTLLRGLSFLRHRPFRARRGHLIATDTQHPLACREAAYPRHR